MTRPADSAVGTSPPGVGVLERGSRRALRSLVGRTTMVDASNLQVELRAVVDAVQAALDGRPPSFGWPEECDRLGLLRRLRSAVLSEWSDDDVQLLPTLRAFDAVESSLSDWSGRGAVPDLLTPFSRELLREVAHTLSSPLGSMVTLASALRDENARALTELQQRRLAIIHRAALTAATLAGDMLSLASREELIETRDSVSIAGTVDEVAGIVRTVTEARGCEVRVFVTDEHIRSGPARALRDVLLSLSLRAALMTRVGAVGIEAVVEEGDVVFFKAVTGDLGLTSDGDAEEQFRIPRADPLSGRLTLSSHGLAIAAVRERIRAIGSELQIGATPSGALQMAFRVTLPTVATGQVDRVMPG